MSQKIIKQLKDKGTGLEFVPVTHWDAITNKPELQGKLTPTQQDAIDSGINSAKVAQVTANATAISNEATARTSADTALSNRIDGVIETIPTKTSNLINDSNFITSGYTYSKQDIDESEADIISAIDIKGLNDTKELSAVTQKMLIEELCTITHQDVIDELNKTE